MGYCAKGIHSSRSMACIVLILFLVVLYIATGHCASIPGKSWPSMKTYDIWGTNTKTVPEQSERNTVTMTNEVLLHDYNQKTSFRNGKVLSEDECKTEDGRRAGICMNVYDCHRKGGTSKGQCALGFGACCVFTATCDQEVKNNITYIISPSFPALMPADIKSCKVKIKMMSPDISQLRFDFVHFSMGQPNRRTGNCDGDLFSLLGGIGGEFAICGQNNGQHIYYDVPNGKARDGEATGEIEMLMNFTSSLAASRFWEIRVSQIPFSQRAPAGCLQYFTGLEGIIQTFNFAENGRHLSNQNYRACVRQETGMCSIAYEPCNEQSFRIGPTQMPFVSNGMNMMGSYSGMGLPFGMINQNGMLAPNGIMNTNPLLNTNGMIASNGMLIGPNGFPQMVGPPGMLNMLDPNVVAAQMSGMAGMPVGIGNLMPGGAGSGAQFANPPQSDQQIQGDPMANPTNGTDIISSTPIANLTETTTAQPLSDEVEGSGDDDTDDDGDIGSLFSLGSLLTRASLFRSYSTNSKRSAKQFYSICTDRITLPCIVEDFISAGMGPIPNCSPIHCGNSLCQPGSLPCRVESTVTPFGIGIHFGDGSNKGSPEDNIGACIRFNQMNCV